MADKPEASKAPAAPREPVVYTYRNEAKQVITIHGKTQDTHLAAGDRIQIASHEITSQVKKFIDKGFLRKI